MKAVYTVCENTNVKYTRLQTCTLTRSHTGAARIQGRESAEPTDHMTLMSDFLEKKKTLPISALPMIIAHLIIFTHSIKAVQLNASFLGKKFEMRQSFRMWP